MNANDSSRPRDDTNTCSPHNEGGWSSQSGGNTDPTRPRGTARGGPDRRGVRRDTPAGRDDTNPRRLPNTGGHPRADTYSDPRETSL